MNIGKTSIRIEVEGCVKCGTRWSSAWFVARTVPVKIGDREEDSITLHICADCKQSMEKESGGEQTSLPL